MPELLRDASGNADRARALLRTAAGGYRATKMLDVLPVAIGLWAEAERRCGHPERARELAAEAAVLLESGSPSLLNEAPIYLALHDKAGPDHHLADADLGQAIANPLRLRNAGIPDKEARTMRDG